MMGIARPDLRTPEQKAAAEKIEIGFLAYSGLAWFSCSECHQSGGLPTFIKHLSECEAGKILHAMCSKLWGGE